MVKSDLSVNTITSDEMKTITERLQQVLTEQNFSAPISWILRQEPEEIDDKIPQEADLSKLILSVDFAMSDDKINELDVFCRITDEEIQSIAEKTVGQRSNELYLIYKKFRLTASNMGFVVDAIARSSFPPSLYGRLLNNSNLDGVCIVCLLFSYR